MDFQKLYGFFNTLKSRLEVLEREKLERETLDIKKLERREEVVERQQPEPVSEELQQPETLVQRLKDRKTLRRGVNEGFQKQINTQRFYTGSLTKLSTTSTAFS